MGKSALPLRAAITTAGQAIMARVRLSAAAAMGTLAGHPAIVLRKRRGPPLVYRPESQRGAAVT